MSEYKLPLVSSAGAAFGLTISEFVSEFVARSTGQTGWQKFGVKVGVKTLLAVIFYSLASRMSGMWSLAMEIATYGTLGSVVPDFFMAWNPGGVIGWAEKSAVVARSMATGSTNILAEMSAVETGIPVTSRM